MEYDHARLLSKSSSFSPVRDEKNRCRIDRNLSLGPIKFNDADENKERGGNEEIIEEEEEKPEGKLVDVSVDDFLDALTAACDGREPGHEPPEIPGPAVDKFVTLVEEEIARYEIREESWPSGAQAVALFDAIGRLAKLAAAATKFSYDAKYYQALNRSGGVLHHAMCLLEDKFHSLFNDARRNQDSSGCDGSSILKPKQQFSFHRHFEHDRSVQAQPPSPECNSGEFPPPYTEETVERLRKIADTMISSGYATECCQVFAVARRNAFETALPCLGFEKVSIEDVTKMPWESLEGEIAAWIRTFKHIMTTVLARERELCDAVFAGRRVIAIRLFRCLAHCVIIQMLSFAEAVAMTKRSAERLFKVLDLYEALRDVEPSVNALIPADEASEELEASTLVDLKIEMEAARCHLGEAAVAMFCDLESSIRADNSKTPVPGGAVHPLTRYVMNYLKYACEYKDTLDQVFREHKHDDGENRSSAGGERKAAESHNPFTDKLEAAMDLLYSNLEAKSKLYRDLALSSIFLMNNGRYVAKKVKGSAEIRGLMGETWYGRRSSNLRQYHKNYQRETWGRVLGCLRDEGLQAKAGSVAKPVLKERFKSFNAMLEDIHKTQSAWVVCDEQLQSELRVSVSAVLVPAYRSFLGRFAQYLHHGRQREKYIKYGAEEVEGLIDELFNGNSSSTASRRWM